MDGTLAKVLLYAVIAFLVTGMFALIRRSNARTLLKSQNEEQVVVRLPKIYFWIGVAGVACFTTLVILMTVLPNNTPPAWVCAVFFMYVLLGGILIIDGSVWKIRIDRTADHLIYTSFVGRTHIIRYADITRFNAGVNTLTLRAGKKTFFIDMQAVNVQILLQMLRQNKVGN